MGHAMMTKSRCAEGDGNAAERMWHGREATVAHVHMIPLVLGGWIVFMVGAMMGAMSGMMMRRRGMMMHMCGGHPMEPRVSAENDER